MRTAPNRKTAGFTLLELCLATALVVGMAGVVAWGLSTWADYREQVRVEAALNLVASGQRNFLIANPTMSYANITRANVTPYIPIGRWPDVLTPLTVVVNTFPPSTTFRGRTLVAKEL